MLGMGPREDGSEASIAVVMREVARSIRMFHRTQMASLRAVQVHGVLPTS